MAVRYETGSTYFPGYTIDPSQVQFLEPDQIARLVLKDRRERYLLEDPTVMKVASTLARRVQRPDVWIRNAVATIDRFKKEVCKDDLPAVLKACLADSSTVELMLKNYRSLHEDVSQVHLASLLFGPKLWMGLNGINVPWEESDLRRTRVHIANNADSNFDPDVRLFMLSLVGTGLTFDELVSIRVGDAGYLDQSGNLIPEILSNPLAVEFSTDRGPKITFLGEEARVALLDSLSKRDQNADDLLFASRDNINEIRKFAESHGRKAIEAGSNVNVVLCQAVGNFFLEWGIPGRNFYSQNGMINPHDPPLSE